MASQTTTNSKTDSHATDRRTTAATNAALGKKGCSYCRQFKPSDQVRVVRTRMGVYRAICDACQQGRRDRTGPPR